MEMLIWHSEGINEEENIEEDKIFIYTGIR